MSSHRLINQAFIWINPVRFSHPTVSVSHLVLRWLAASRSCRVSIGSPCPGTATACRRVLLQDWNIFQAPIDLKSKQINRWVARTFGMHRGLVIAAWLWIVRLDPVDQQRNGSVFPVGLINMRFQIIFRHPVLFQQS